jgi:hypothetical protein
MQMCLSLAATVRKKKPTLLQHVASAYSWCIRKKVDMAVAAALLVETRLFQVWYIKKVSMDE